MSEKPADTKRMFHIRLVDENESDFRKQSDTIEIKNEEVNDKSWSVSESKDLPLALDYKRKFRAVYSDRRELAFVYKNEHDIPRVACSFIAPTSSPAQYGLHSYKDCAQFVVSCCAFDKLDPPYDFPTKSKSPNFCLQSKRGNSLEISLVLASMLIALGYNAYVAVGYASKELTENYFLDQLYNVQSDQKDFDLADLADIMKKSKQYVQSNAISGSKYQSRLLNKLGINTESPVSLSDIVNVSDDKKSETKEKADDDELFGLRVHYWVLINSGKHEIIEPFFIDTGSGQVYHTDNEHFLGLEFVFNNDNIWVNMQPCVNGLKGISFDLCDCSLWEFLLGPNQYLASNPAPKIMFNNDNVNMLKKHRVFEYRNSRVEILSGQTDGLVKRVSVKNDVGNFVEILEWFTGREDKLAKRLRRGQKIYEIFDAPKSCKLIEFTNEVLTFAAFRLETRLDSLSKYHLKSNGKVKIYFAEDREDSVRTRTLAMSSDGSFKLITDKLSNRVISNESAISKCIFDLTSDKMNLVLDKSSTTLIPMKLSFEKVSGNKKTFYERVEIETSDNHYSASYDFTEGDLLEFYDFLLVHENSAVQSAKAILRDVQDIVKSRLEEEYAIHGSGHGVELPETKTKAIQSTKNISSVHVSKRATNDGDDVDYLSAFLVGVNLQIMSVHDAERIKDACLCSMKERLILQAQILQTRYESEKLLLKHTEQKLVGINSAEKSRIKKEVEDIAFRIKVLETRMEKQKDKAMEKYLQLDAALKNDPRMKVNTVSSSMESLKEIKK